MTPDLSALPNKAPRERVDAGAMGFGFIIWGIIYAVAFLIPTLATGCDLGSRFMLWFSIASICTGFGMALVGVGIIKKSRFILFAAVPLFVFGLFQFPAGTAIFGWSLRSLWYSRHHFYPFDKDATEA